MAKCKCDMDMWYCQSIRDKWRRKCKRCDQWQQGEIKMFKNLTILVLVIIVLMFGIDRGGFSIRPRAWIGREVTVESRLMDAARLLEEAKTDAVLKTKVDKLIESW